LPKLEGSKQLCFNRKDIIRYVSKHDKIDEILNVSLLQDLTVCSDVPQTTYALFQKGDILICMNIIVITAIFAAGLALALGIALGIFRKAFHVETDVLVGLIRETLPGANCGACGFPGCDGFAAAVAARVADPGQCSVSGADETKKRGDLLGVDVSSTPQTAMLACQGSVDCAKSKGIYTGVPSCRGAKISTGSTKLCTWGCLGFGDCVKVCPFGAIAIGSNGLPSIDVEKCTGCGKCSAECPQLLLKQVPRSAKGAFALCANRNTIKPMVRKTCTAGCIKCGSCEKKCPPGAIKLENGIPVVDYGKCTMCGTCLTSCPSKVFAMLGGGVTPTDTSAA
jgi:Na+-translocating ferredoxin:NAD+ oxidoreductase RNF subunit RnfB